MGDWFQRIVDVDATEEDAARLGADVERWLIERGVIVAEEDDCVLSADRGHRPGPRVEEVVEPTRSEDWKRLWTCGLAVRRGRAVFDCGQGEARSVTCPRCALRIRLLDERWEPLEDVWSPFSDAVGLWYRTGAADVTCPGCAAGVPLREWQWEDDCFALAHLGLEFWNWPRLTDAFVSEVARRLGGHRVLHMAGKL
ncbi:hypothetical protein [Streptomyces beihaiensis]|uniref:Uncharacterized protein n=1 Tax=Streptomyces beihaiensis TaxID=2984495 RepID=A0ABT3TRT2_9ACTN|nr:hypothetical protein [Streptomyces beihaiensis]MCX3059739.1 hypothetical protein [Streptomyces beihaiensis]